MFNLFVIWVVGGAGEWPKFHHDLCNTGYQDELKGCLTNPTIKWTWGTPHDSGVGTNPVIVDIDNDDTAEIFAGEYYNHRVYAFNGEDGSVIWAYQTGSYIWSSSAAIADINNDGTLEVVLAQVILKYTH